MLRLFILLFILVNIVYQKIVKYIVENSIFLFLWGFKMQIKTKFLVLEFGYLALEKCWKCFGHFLKGVCTNPGIFLARPVMFLLNIMPLVATRVL